MFPIFERHPALGWIGAVVMALGPAWGNWLGWPCRHWSRLFVLVITECQAADTEERRRKCSI